MALDFNPFEADSKPAQTPQTKKQRLRAFDDPQIKPSAGSDQTPIKVVSNSHQNQYQTPIKVVSNSHQSGINQQAPRQQTDITTPITTPIKVVSNSHQSGIKLPSETKTVFTSLVGLQRALILIVFQECLQKRSHSTGPLSLEHLSSSVGTTPRTTKIALKRLGKKGLLGTLEFKNGRGGWTNYQLPDEVFQDIFRTTTDTKVISNSHQSDIKLPSQLPSQLPSSLSSSSSYINNKETTTTGGDQEPLFDPARVQLSPQWLAVNLEPLAAIGFTQTHLIQIVSQAKLTPELVQESINHFAFDLRVNSKGREMKGPPINFFMGILRKGFPYTAPENYKSAEDEALETYFQIQKRLLEARQTREKTLCDVELEKWLLGLTETEKSNLAPSGGLGGERAQQAKLANHFQKNIWPEIRANITAQRPQEVSV